MVLHGGGNTSVKLTITNVVGEQVEVLAIKGSGWDLSNIEPEGFPLVDLQHCRKLQQLKSLEDGEMVKQLRSHMQNPSSPTPSVETLLHAIFPHKYVDHSHSDAMIGIINQPDAEKICRELYGNTMAIVPYIMPGFDLSRLAKEYYEKDTSVEGLILLKHGLFTFGDTAKESYERHIQVVAKAVEYTQKQTPKPLTFPTSREILSEDSVSIIRERTFPLLRGIFSELSKKQHWIVRHCPSAEALDFADSNEVTEWSQRGPLTPDHVIRTKGFPLLLSQTSQFLLNAPEEDLRTFLKGKVEEYMKAYELYFQRQNELVTDKKIPLDSLPRVILLGHVGLVTVGRTVRDVNIAADIYLHTIRTIRDAMAVGSYEPVNEADRFDMEYWSLEQAKLKVGVSSVPTLQGQSVLITGGASGIGKACAEIFGKAGAALFLTDLNAKALEETAKELKGKKLIVEWSVMDVAQSDTVRRAFREMIRNFGGIDILVSNAGKAFQAPGMASCPEDVLQQSMAVNFFGHQNCAAVATEIMLRQQTGGSLLFNISKAAINPGKNFGPYCVAKAATMALMKQYALEYSPLGIRSNAVNADRVRTNLFSEELIQQRASARNIQPDEYFRSNLLGEEVLAVEVASAFLQLALATKTSASVFTVDGGNIEASLR